MAIKLKRERLFESNKDRRIAAILEALKKGPFQTKALRQMYEEAGFVGKTKQTLSRDLNELKENGLIEKRTDHADPKKKEKWILTQNGEVYLESLHIANRLIEFSFDTQAHKGKMWVAAGKRGTQKRLFGLFFAFGAEKQIQWGKLLQFEKDGTASLGHIQDFLGWLINLVLYRAILKKPIPKPHVDLETLLEVLRDWVNMVELCIKNPDMTGKLQELERSVKENL